MDRRIDDVRPAHGLEWEQPEAADSQDKDATIAALNQQLAAARNEALEEAAARCVELINEGRVHSNFMCAKAIRALASHPAAPVQIEDDTFDALLVDIMVCVKQGGDVKSKVKAIHEHVAAMTAAPPVQQTGDVRGESDLATSECPDCHGSGEAFGSFACEECGGQGKIIVEALATTRPSAELVSLVNAAIGKAFADSPVNAIRAQDVIKPFLPELTRPSAALTEPEILKAAAESGIYTKTQMGCTFDPCKLIPFARAILAASGGAHAVPVVDQSAPSLSFVGLLESQMFKHPLDELANGAANPKQRRRLVREVRAAIQMCAAAQRQASIAELFGRGWIKTDERLPEPYEEVRILFDGVSRIARLNHSREYFQLATFIDAKSQYIASFDRVAGWMPLPAAPTQDQGEGK